MISAFFIKSSTGVVLASQTFKDGIRPDVHKGFDINLITQPSKLNNNILTLGSYSYIHLHKNSIYFVAVASHNIDASVVLHYIEEFIEILEILIGGIVNDVVIRANVSHIYDIINATIDQGHITAQNLEDALDLNKLRVGWKKRETNVVKKKLEISNSIEELTPLMHIDTTEECLNNDVSLQVNELIHVPVDGHIKIAGELLCVSNSTPFDLRIKVAINTDNIHTAITSVDSQSSIEDIKCKIDKEVTNVLMYQGYCTLSELPIAVTGKMRQINAYKFNLEVNIIVNKHDNLVRNLSIKIPISRIVSTVQAPVGDVHVFEDELSWDIPVLNLRDFDDIHEDRVCLKQTIVVGGNCDLGEWLKQRESWIVTYDVDGFNACKYDIICYNTSNSSLSKSVKYRSLFTYEIDI